MAIENADYIHELNSTQPIDTDFVEEGNEELAQLKRVMQTQFPAVPLGPVVNAGENPNEPDETLTAPANIMLWSPKAIADFIKANFGGWNLTPATGSNSFRCIMTPNQTLPDQSAYLVQWDDPLWDTGTWWDSANQRFVPQQAGIWRFKAMMLMSWSNDANRADELIMDIRLNGVSERRATIVANPANIGDSGHKQSIAVDGMFEVNGVDDYVDVYLAMKKETGRTESIPAGNDPAYETSFEGAWIGDAPAPPP